MACNSSSVSGLMPEALMIAGKRLPAALMVAAISAGVLPIGAPEPSASNICWNFGVWIARATLCCNLAMISDGVFAAKAHVVYDPNAERPVYFVTTPANVLMRPFTLLRAPRLTAPAAVLM